MSSKLFALILWLNNPQALPARETKKLVKATDTFIAVENLSCLKQKQAPNHSCVRLSLCASRGDGHLASLHEQSASQTDRKAASASDRHMCLPSC